MTQPTRSDHPQIIVNRAAITGGICAATSFWLAAQAGTVWLQVIGCALVGMLLAAFATVAVIGDGDVVVTVEVPDAVTVGEPYVTTVRVVNGGTRPSPPLSISYVTPTRRQLVAPVTAYFDPVPAGARDQAAVSVSPVARGLATQSLIVAERTGPFGFFTRREAWQVGRRLAVLPARATPLPLPALGGGPSGADGPLRPGLDVQSVREYRAGDAPRHVHWRTTARTGRLSVLERAERTAGALGVVLIGTGGEPAFEAAMAIAAATVGAAVGDGVDVHAWVETAEQSGPLRRLAMSDCMEPFLVQSPKPPDDEGVSALLVRLGSGGALLIARGGGPPAPWYVQLCAAAAATGTEVIDVAAWLPPSGLGARPGPDGRQG